MHEWKPIESAPRDGRKVLAFISEDWIEGVRWLDEQWQYASDGDSLTPGRNAPKFWMPWPAPPVDEDGPK